MTGNSAIEAKKYPAATAAGVKTRANASATDLKKGAKVRPAILTEDQRYELARKAEEARIMRHDLRDRLRESIERLTSGVLLAQTTRLHKMEKLKHSPSANV